MDFKLKTKFNIGDLVSNCGIKFYPVKHITVNEKMEVFYTIGDTFHPPIAEHTVKHFVRVTAVVKI